MRIKAWHIFSGIIFILTLAFSGCIDLPLGSIYENQWEIKTQIAGVEVGPTDVLYRVMMYPDRSPPRYWQVWDKGYSRMYFDPDGGEAPNKDLPNVEIEIGHPNPHYDWPSRFREWTKEVTHSRQIEVGEEKQYYVVEEYTFELMVSVTADMKHLFANAVGNDLFESETDYARGGSRPGHAAMITVYPELVISPWEAREGESVGAWIMNAWLDRVEVFTSQVDAARRAGSHGSTGYVKVLTGLDQLNMRTDVRGRELTQYSFQEGIAPSTTMRPRAVFPITVEMQPGHYYSGLYASKTGASQLREIPRDVIFVIKVEVLRTRNWKIEGGGGKEKDEKERDLPESFKDAFMLWGTLGPEIQLLLMVGLGLIIIIVVLPYLGIGLPAIFSSLLKRK